MSVDSLRTMCPIVALITRIPLIRNFSAYCLTFFCNRTFFSPKKLSLYRPWQTPRASEVSGSQHRQSCLLKCVYCSHYYSFPGRLWRAIICITSGDIFSMTLSLEKYCEWVTFLSKIIFHAHWPLAMSELRTHVPELIRRSNFALASWVRSSLSLWTRLFGMVRRTLRAPIHLLVSNTAYFVWSRIKSDVLS
jgi:hypothetical protein